VFVLIIFFTPRFEPIFSRLAEKGELSQLTRWLVAFVGLNAECFYLPAVLTLIGLLCVDEAAVLLLRRRKRGSLWSWLWVIVVGVAGLLGCLVVVVGLLLPLFKMSSALR